MSLPGLKSSSAPLRGSRLAHAPLLRDVSAGNSGAFAMYTPEQEANIERLKKRRPQALGVLLVGLPLALLLVKLCKAEEWNARVYVPIVIGIAILIGRVSTVLVQRLMAKK